MSHLVILSGHEPAKDRLLRFSLPLRSLFQSRLKALELPRNFLPVLGLDDDAVGLVALRLAGLCPVKDA